MSNRAPSIFAYLALLVLSLPVPLLHHYHTDRVIETMRPVIKLADGHWAPMLMPVDVLLVRWLGQFSWSIPCALVALLTLSLSREVFSRASTICVTAICQCAFTTFYAFYATLILGVQWLDWTQQRTNQAQRTAPGVTVAASAAAFPSTMQLPRRSPQSLSLGA